MRKSACFTGHRTIKTDMNSFSALLLSVIEQMITDRNITDYYAGGAYGFDAIASLSVLRLKEKYPEVRLHLILPCPFDEQSAKWNEAQKAEYQHILGLADSVVKSQVKHTTIRQKVYKKYSPQNVQVNE